MVNICCVSYLMQAFFLKKHGVVNFGIYTCTSFAVSAGIMHKRKFNTHNLKAKISFDIYRLFDISMTLIINLKMLVNI